MKSGPTNRRTKCLSAGKKFSATVLAASMSIIALAEATTDGSVGTAGIQTLSGRFTIPEAMGTNAGLNLFHSFSRFNINANESATFTTTSSSIQNVISRVTGGEQSLINGLLKLDAVAGSTPDFFLINPAGVVFGSGAQIDVPAGFHVTTARKLKFADGFAWDTVNATTSSLTIAAPESFGFVGLSAAAVKFNNLDAGGAPDVRPNIIPLKSGNNLNIVASTVEFDSTTLSLPAGNLRVIATGTKTIDVSLSGEIGAPLFGSIGANHTELSSSGVGSVLFEGGTTRLLNSKIISNNDGSLPAGPVRIIAENILFSDDGGVVTRTSGLGAAASVSIRAQSMTIDGKGVFAGIASESSGPGSTGAINVDLAQGLSIRNAGEIASRNLGSGTGSDISIQARSLTIDGQGKFAGIRLRQDVDASNKGSGSIDINLSDRLWVKDGGRISSTTLSLADAGSIGINAGSLVIGGEGVQAGVFGESGLEASGNAGALRIKIRDDVLILGEGLVSASTKGAGSAGEIHIDARSVTIDGQGTTAAISSETTGEIHAGAGGTIQINVDDKLSIRNGGLVSARTSGTGHGGLLDIHSKSLTIDGAGAFDFLTGLYTRQESTGSGGAGAIMVETVEGLSIINGGEISSQTTGAGAAGGVDIHTGSLTIDGQDAFASISSRTFGDGGAGHITIRANGAIRVLGAGQIMSSTFGLGAGGPIKIEANSVTVRGGNTGIFSEAALGSSGQTGALTITAHESVTLADSGSLSIENNALVPEASSLRPTALSVSSPRIALASGARITSETAGNVPASKLFITPSSPSGTLQITGDGTVEVTSSTRMPNPEDIGFGEPLPEHGTASAGDVDLRAGSLTLFNVAIASQAKAGTTGSAGRVNIAVDETLLIKENARLTTDTFGAGNAGSILINARNLLLTSAEITSNANAGALGSAGNVNLVITENLDLRNSAQISSSTSSVVGAAGAVDVKAARILVDGTDSAIRATAARGSSGVTGNLSLLATSGLTLTNGGSLSVENDAIAENPSDLAPTTLSVTTPRIVFSGGGKITAETRGNVAASEITLRPATDGVGSLSITAQSGSARGDITSSTLGSGDAGKIGLTASEVTLSNVAVASSAKSGSGGSAGTVELKITGDAQILRGSRITTDTADTGSAGDIKIIAANLVLDQSEISSGTLAGSSGNGGSVEMLLADRVDLANGGGISTSTQGAGGAGSIDIKAGDVSVLGLSSRIQATADRGSSGQTGNINLTAARSVTLGDRASLSIQNDALQSEVNLARFGAVAEPLGVVPSTLSITAARISVDGAQISASSAGNITASNLQLRALEGLTLRGASLTTTAQNGDGGRIGISTGGILLVDHSQVTTSVLGTKSGSGGNIQLQTDTLLMNTGFIQANTAAPQATGGNINIDVGLLVAKGVLLVGGDTSFRFDPNLIGVNIIQAASPNGVSGNVNVSGPIIDTAGNLRELSSKPVENPVLESDLCRRSAGSSFTPVGSRGLRARSAGWIRSEEPAIKFPDLLFGAIISLTECH